MRTPTYQYFTLSEYQERLDALRNRDAATRHRRPPGYQPRESLLPLGYQTPGYYWYQASLCRSKREPVFIVRLNENSNVQPLSWVEDSRPYEDHEDWITHTRNVLADLGLDNKRMAWTTILFSCAHEMKNV